MAVRRKVITISGATLAGAAALLSAATPLLGKVIDRILPPPASEIVATATYKPGYGPPEARP